MKALFVSLVLFVSSIASAQGLQFEFTGLVGFDNEVEERITFSPTKTGKIMIKTGDLEEIVVVREVIDNRKTEGVIELRMDGDKVLRVYEDLVFGTPDFELQVGERVFNMEPAVQVNVLNMVKKQN